MTTFVILFRVIALVCFGFAAWQCQSPVWNRVVAVGLTALAASFIAWPV